MPGKKPTEKANDGFYDIEEILKEKTVKKEVQYFVKWKGYDATQNSWVPESSFKKKDIEAYKRNKEHKKKATATASARIPTKCGVMKKKSVSFSQDLGKDQSVGRATRKARGKVPENEENEDRGDGHEDGEVIEKTHPKKRRMTKYLQELPTNGSDIAQVEAIDTNQNEPKTKNRRATQHPDTMPADDELPPDQDKENCDVHSETIATNGDVASALLPVMPTVQKKKQRRQTVFKNVCGENIDFADKDKDIIELPKTPIDDNADENIRVELNVEGLGFDSAKKLMFLVKFSDGSEEVVDRETAHSLYPKLLLDYYESRMEIVYPEENGA